MRKSIIAIAAAAALVASGVASATGQSRSGSIVVGGNNASAWAGTSGGAVTNGNGFAANEGAAYRSSTSTLDLSRSPSLVGAAGTANTAGHTVNHSIALGNAAAGGRAHSSGDANFWARGRMSGRSYALDGTRASFDGGMVLRGGVDGESSTKSGAIYRGKAGGFAADESGAAGSALADFDFNRRTGADYKEATVDTSGYSVVESGKYRAGLAGVRTGAEGSFRVGGDANVDATLVNTGCIFRCR